MDIIFLWTNFGLSNKEGHPKPFKSRGNKKRIKIMATRIFKFESQDFYGESTMVFLEESEITHRYNRYGVYQKLADFAELMQYYREERRAAFEDFVQENENYTLADVKAFIASFNDEYEYWPDGHFRQYGRPTILVECRDEDWVSDGDGYYDEYGNPVELEAIEVHEYWDGHNWREDVLDNTYNPQVSEVTDEYCAVEDMEEFGYWRGGTSGGHFLWDAENEKIIKYEWSAYQGQGPTWEEVKVIDLVRMIDEHPTNERLVELINEELAEYDLKKGEKLYLEDGAVTFEYRAEKYHYSNEEISDEYMAYGEMRFGTTIDLSIAREAIRKRRVEAITSKFAKNNYEKVLELPLQKIWVTYENSIQAGNCQEVSTKVMKEIMNIEQIASREFAYRADALLLRRDDNYTRRAVLNAYQTRLRA